MRLLSLTILFLLTLSGCQTVTVQNPRPGDPGVALPTGRTPTDEEAVASDPCAIRLDHVVEALIQYYMLNKQLPVSLDELKPYADMGTTLGLTCTVTGQPYQYFRDGLLCAGQTKRIIVADPTPAHHGNRWCIVMPPPGQTPQGQISMEVISIPQAVFATYVPPIQ